MIRVIVELHPNQLREHWRLGTIDISNVSDCQPLSDYKIEATLSERSSAAIEAEQSDCIEEAVVIGHRRDEGWQRLVERSLRALQKGALRVRAPSVAVCEEALNALQEIYSGLATPEARSLHAGDLADVERLLQWVRIHGPTHDEGAELMRLRDVIRTGGAMYRLERAAMGYPGGVDSELATCRTCGEQSKYLEPYCTAHRPCIRPEPLSRVEGAAPEILTVAASLDAARVLAISALSDVEWSGVSRHGDPCCLSCGSDASASETHLPDCLLDKALMACRKAAPSAEI